MDLTEPVLAPLRRVIPPAGMFDLSFTVLIVFLFILRALRLQVTPIGERPGGGGSKATNSGELRVYSGPHGDHTTRAS